MRHVWAILTAVGLASALAACGADDAAEPAPPRTGGTDLPHEHAAGEETSKVPTAYERVRDALPHHGAADAEAVWAAGKRAVLLFSASW